MENKGIGDMREVGEGEGVEDIYWALYNMGKRELVVVKLPGVHTWFFHWLQRKCVLFTHLHKHTPHLCAEIVRVCVWQRERERDVLSFTLLI